jgi:Chaperone of endosialidase
VGSKSETPATPDYYGLANQQFGQNQQLLEQQTQANRPNQATPWGATNWSQDPQGNWSEIQSLNPQEQANLTGQQSQTGTNIAAGRNLFNSSGIGNGLNGAPQVHGGQYYDKDARDAVWNQFQSMENPLMDQQSEQQISQLQAQGLRAGDPAYDSAMRNLASSQGAERNNAMSQSVLTGSQVGAQNQGMDVQAQNAFDQQRMGNYNLFNGLMGNQQGSLQMPGFTGAGQGQGADLMGAANSAYGAALNQTNAQNASNAQTTQGIESLIGAYAMYAGMAASDERLKKNKEKVGKTPGGANLFSFHYKGEDSSGPKHTGVMAQEMERKQPDTVFKDHEGTRYVDYSRVR